MTILASISPPRVLRRFCKARLQATVAPLPESVGSLHWLVLARRTGGAARETRRRGAGGCPSSRHGHRALHGLPAQVREDAGVAPCHLGAFPHRCPHVPDAAVAPRVADHVLCPPPDLLRGIHEGRPDRQLVQWHLAAAAPPAVPRHRRAVLRGLVDDGDPAKLAVKLPRAPDERGRAGLAVRAERPPAVVRERPERGKPAVAPRVRGAGQVPQNTERTYAREYTLLLERASIRPKSVSHVSKNYLTCFLFFSCSISYLLQLNL